MRILFKYNEIHITKCCDLYAYKKHAQHPMGKHKEQVTIMWQKNFVYFSQRRMGKIAYFLMTKLRLITYFHENLSLIFDSGMLTQNSKWKWLFLCLQGIYYCSPSVLLLMWITYTSCKLYICCTCSWLCSGAWGMECCSSGP